MRELDFHLIYMLLPLSVLAGAASFFGSAPGIFLGMGLFAVAQFLIITRAMDRSRGGRRVPFVLVNETAAAMVIITLVVLPSLFKG